MKSKIDDDADIKFSGWKLMQYFAGFYMATVECIVIGGSYARVLGVLLAFWLLLNNVIV